MEQKKLQMRKLKPKTKVAPKTASVSVAELLDLKKIAENARKTLARLIDSAEGLAKRGVDFQKQTTRWAKGTPLATVFEKQRELSENLIEGSTKLVRKLGQIEKPRSAKAKAA